MDSTNQDIYTLLDNSGIPSESGYVSGDPRTVVESVLQETPKKFRQYLAVLAATLSAVSAGMVLAWTSPIEKDLINGDFRGIKLNHDQMGWIGSFVTLGAMAMCIPTGFICDLIGRKRTLLLLLVPFISGWLLIVFAKNVIMLYFGRLITGMATGACCIAAPLYANEIAHKSLRGTLGSYFQLMITVGILLAYIGGKLFTPVNFTIMCTCFPFAFFLLFVFQPETPTYLLKRGLYNEAKLSLTKVRGQWYNIDSEMQEIEGSVKEGTQRAVSLTESLKKKSIRKAFFISAALYFFQQFSGVNTIIFYMSSIFDATGESLDSQNAAIIVGIFQTIATFVSSLVVDKLGRRFLLLLSSFVIALSVIQLAVYFTLKYRLNVDENVLQQLSFLPVGALCLFIIAFALGLGPVPWIVASEIFPTEVKSVMSSITATLNWFLAFFITKFYVSVSDVVGEDSTFYFFGGVSLICVLFIYFVLPETKGKTIAEIQDELEN